LVLAYLILLETYTLIFCGIKKIGRDAKDNFFNKNNVNLMYRACCLALGAPCAPQAGDDGVKAKVDRRHTWHALLGY